MNSLNSSRFCSRGLSLVTVILVSSSLVNAQDGERAEVVANESPKADYGVPTISTGPSVDGSVSGERRTLSVDGLIDVIKQGRSGGEPVSEGVNPSAKAEGEGRMVSEGDEDVSRQVVSVEPASGSGEVAPAASYDVPFLMEEAKSSVSVLKLNASADRVDDWKKGSQGARSEAASEADVAEPDSAVSAAGGDLSLPVSTGDPRIGSIQSEDQEKGGGDATVEQVAGGESGVRELSWSTSGAGAHRAVPGASVVSDTHVREAPAAPVGEDDHVGDVSWVDGYFPTQSDTYYFGDRDYQRYGGDDRYVRPDLRSQLATGLAPYGNQDPTFYDRNSYVFDPLDNALGFFADHQALAWESQRLQGYSFAVDGDLPFFTRSFEPDKAHVKAGPLYLDLLSVGAGVLYSDYDGNARFPEGQEDGWLSYGELQMRALFQISNDFYIAASGRMVYLPGANRVAFRLGNGYGPNVLGLAKYETGLNAWDLLVFNQVSARSYGDLLDSGALDRAGRYQFGFADVYRGRDYFDDEAFFLLNHAGAKASTLLSPDWRFNAAIDRFDSWRTHDFDSHVAHHHAGALVGYEGSDLPFSPYASYDVDTVDESFDSFFHRIYIGGRGRITENLRVDARGGYLWTSGLSPDHESALWDVALTHDLSQRTIHSVRFGQDFFIDDFTGDTLVADYVRYDIGHQFSRRVYGRAYAQISEDEYLAGSDLTGTNQLYGANVNVRPLDYTLVTAGAAYQKRDIETDGRDNEHMLYFLRVNQQLASRTTLWFKYQFEEAELFDEHLYSTGIRKYF